MLRSTPSGMSDALAAAIENLRVEVIAYLMEHGFQLNSGLACAAASTKSIPVFQTLLDHGWDINDAGRASPSLGHGFLMIYRPSNIC